jgi:hypothetical protein
VLGDVALMRREMGRNEGGTSEISELGPDNLAPKKDQPSAASHLLPPSGSCCGFHGDAHGLVGIRGWKDCGVARNPSARGHESSNT